MWRKSGEPKSSGSPVTPQYLYFFPLSVHFNTTQGFPYRIWKLFSAQHFLTETFANKCLGGEIRGFQWEGPKGAQAAAPNC